MLKRCFLLLVALFLLTQCFLFPPSAQSAGDPNIQDAFENGTLALREIKFIFDYTGYALRAPAIGYELVLKGKMEGAAPVYSEDGAWVSLDLNGKDFHAVPYFFSPDGSKAILMDEEYAYILKDKVITMILPNYLRSVHDDYGSFTQFNKLPPAQWAGSEGITWSPDGRYAVLTNFRQIFMMMRLIYGLYIIDTETGEMFCAETYPNKITDDWASVIQTCFDVSGRYLYYTVYGRVFPDSLVSLMRYDMETGEKQRLLACPQNAAYPRLAKDSSGRLINLTDANRADEFLGLNVFEQNNGLWKVNAFAFSQPSANVRPLYMDIGSADMGVMLQTVIFDGRPSMLPGRFHADRSFTGHDELLLIDGFDAPKATVLPLNAYGDGSELAGRILNGDVLQCLNIKLSPDGHYALLLVTDRQTYSFLMMDMETLALKIVQTPPGAASMRAGNGIGPSNAYPSGYNWFEGNKVVILTGEDLKLYEFVY